MIFSRMMTCSAALLIAGTLVLYPGVATAQEAAKPDAPAAAADGGKTDTYKQLNLFGDVFERVRAEYVDELTDKALIEHALNGMLSNLDPHSSYMNQDEYKSMEIQNSGEFGGLGIEVTMENGVVKVVSPIDDTPAFRAGMQAGDLIVKIDNEPVSGMTLSDAVKKMRGKVGSEITLTVIREGAKEPLTVKLVRDIIQIQSARSRVEGNVGYLRVTTFNQQTFKGLKKGVEDIKKELGDKIIGYVLDLRNNPGGLLDQAILVSDAFLEQGEIVSTRGRHKDDVRRDSATPGDLTGGMPIVVLVNGGSASASEIVAGALQDHKRGIVLGTQSFGKGSVQTIISIPGHGAIRLTTARYFTPSGRSIQAKGITPDIVVERAAVYEAKDLSGEYKESDLKGALANPDGDEDPSVKPADKKDADKDADKDKKDGKDKKPQIEDYQLTRALDLLQGISLYKNALK